MKNKTLILLGIIMAFAISCKKLDMKEPGNLVPKTVTEDLSLPSITVNGAKLHSETFGNHDNAMVVVLHGGPGGDYKYMLDCKALADDGYFVVFYDQRGSGLSQRFDKDSYNIQVMLDELTAVISYYRRSPGQKIFLLGHSWGAMLATAYVNSYPAAIDGLILGEPGGFTWDEAKGFISRSQKINVFNESTNDVLYFDQIITGKEDEQEILDYKKAVTSAFMDDKGNAWGNAGAVPFWRMGAIVQKALFDLAEKENFDWTTNLSQYKTKVLFCYSELDKAYGLEYAKLLSSAYPSVQLEEIKGSGHDFIYFGWNNFYPLAKNYLNSLK